MRWVGRVILRVFSLFLCPLSMTPGYLSFLLQSLGGASVTQKALRSATTVRGALIGCARNRKRKSFMHMVTGVGVSETSANYCYALNQDPCD